MKAKKLLLIAALFTGSILNLSAQNLLISENFSTEEWETELIRLNPTYITPAVNGSFTNLFSGLYMDKYELFSGAIECGDGALPCADGSMVHNNGGSGVGWRLKNKSSGVSYLTLPTISSAGTFTVHVKCGGTNAANNYMELQRVDTIEGVPVITVLKEWSLSKSNATKFATQLDELKTQWVDSREPVTLRIGQATTGAGVFIKIFGFSVEEHASVPLKHSIDSATVIRTANSENIGNAYGQYPQEAYDALGTAITNATAIFDNTASTRTQLIDGTTSINTAITDFEASKVDVGTGIGKPMFISFKQFGRKLVINKPATISIYNTVGTLVYQQDQVQVMEIPAYVGKGVFIVKSGPGVQKIYLGE